MTFSIRPPHSLTLAPGYSLIFRSTSEGYAGLRIDDDLRAVAAAFRQRRYLLTGPVYDLFAPGLSEQFERETARDVAAYYHPSVKLTLTRGFGSYIRDLFIPARVAVEVSRSVRRIEDSVYDTLTATSQLRATAINLFGSLGAYPILPFYESDEFSWSVDVSMDLSDLGDYTGVMQHFFFFLGSNGIELSVENRFELESKDASSWKESIEAVLLWNTPLSNGISLPIINIDIKKDVYFSHKESLTFEVAGSFAHSEILLGHSSEFFLGDIGSLSALLHIGVTSEENTWFFGAEGGLKARISF